MIALLGGGHLYNQISNKFVPLHVIFSKKFFFQSSSNV